MNILKVCLFNLFVVLHFFPFPAMATDTIEQTAQPQIRVFYDGACALCAWEMGIYKERDINGSIEFLDISRPDFDFETYDLDPTEAQKILHADTPNGRVLGVQAFKAIWGQLDGRLFHTLDALSDYSLFCSAMNGAYKCFVKVRPYLPKTAALPPACQDGVCDISNRYSPSQKASKACDSVVSKE